MPAIPPRLAYLVSAYPATSHIFILREVLSLRAKGWEIFTASINPDTRDPASLDAQERLEQANTLVIKQWPRWRLLLDLLSVTKCYGIFAVLGAFSQAIQLARPGYRGHLLAVAYWLEAMLLAYWLHQQKTQHLHVHFGNEAAMVGLLCKQISACTLSYTIHGPDEFQDARGQQLAAKVAAADQIICISQFARSQLMLFSAKQHWHKMQVVRLGVDSHYALPPCTQSRPCTVLCVGRLTPAKGQHLLIQAVHELKNEGLCLRLILAGAGPDETSLRTQAETLGLQEQVVFAGPLPREAIRQRYTEADIFVLPSFAEGIPVVLMEAMACGLPCISTRVAGIPELIEHKVNGLLLAPGDENDLRDGIRQLATNASLRTQLGEAAKLTVARHYRLESNLEQLANCLAKFSLGASHA